MHDTNNMCKVCNTSPAGVAALAMPFAAFTLYPVQTCRHYILPDSYRLVTSSTSVHA